MPSRIGKANPAILDINSSVSGLYSNKDCVTGQTSASSIDEANLWSRPFSASSLLTEEFPHLLHLLGYIQAGLPKFHALLLMMGLLIMLASPQFQNLAS